jgi:hypothetical protein
VNVDPITFAVIKSGLDSIADDMAYTVVRIARSEIVKDVMDFSAALCAADGQMVAQAKTIAQHLGAIPEAMEAMLGKFGDDLHDGDVVIMNDPYHGGMHLPDIFMFVPIFHDGRRRAFAVVICHHTDVGGRVPGSNASDSTEIYQEGLRIPPLKLYSRGELNTTLETLIKINVRVPDRVWAISPRSSPRPKSAREGSTGCSHATAPRPSNPTCRNCSIMPNGARATKSGNGRPGRTASPIMSIAMGFRTRQFPSRWQLPCERTERCSSIIRAPRRK